jgi:hypothetical protein
MFFRLKEKCGTHSQNGKTYHPGDVVETDMDLSVKFHTKFVKIYDDEDKKDTGKKTPKIATPPDPASKKTEADKDNKSKSASVSKKSKKKVKKTKGKKKNSKKYGVNVTEDFPLAEDNGLRVYEKSKVFSIIEMDADNKKVCLKKTKKKDVVNFIEAMLEDEIHDDEDDD